MANETLNSLLKEYEQKKLNAELDLDRRKENLYKLIPRLEEIDSELSTLGISTAKNILNSVKIISLTRCMKRSSEVLCKHALMSKKKRNSKF